METSLRYEESQPLLRSPVAGSGRSAYKRKSNQFLKNVCLPSKATALLVCLAVVIGALHAVFTCLFVACGIYFVGGEYINQSVAICLSYLVMSLAVFIYPMSGFIADVKYGRYRVLRCSVCLITISLIFMLGCTAVVLADPYATFSPWSHLKLSCFFVFLALFGAFFGIGSIIYYSNFIQFGLDQLMEAPSEYLSLFVHWIVWADSLAFAVILPLAASLLCRNVIVVLLTCSILIICSLLLITLLFIIGRNRHWFFTEPGQDNPYKSVMNVLTFAWKHTYPLQRSAFTYCDDVIPSRLDFGKQIYGGPYSTEQVEDVKTLFQMVLVLLVVGPVYVLNVSNESYGLPLIGVHLSHEGRHFCNLRFILLESGALKYVTSAVIFPVYIAVMFSYQKMKRPSILTRLGVGLFLFLAGVLSVLITDIVGHAQFEVQPNSSSLCMFAMHFDAQQFIPHLPSLEMPWASLIPINLLLGIGPLLVLTTVFEFIAAQSPHSMKGLVVGLFFVISGFFQLLGAFALLPFSLKNIWQSQDMKEDPPVTNCGFGYFLSVCVAAAIGLFLYLIVAKKYKFRERDDYMPFHYGYAEVFYDREIRRREQESDSGGIE
jgi:peptide/histidine transporter 3/4